MSVVKLSKIEQETLTAFRGLGTELGLWFKGVAQNCETPPHQIRRSVRALARKGLLEYRQALFCEDSNTLGAGYMLTAAGVEYLEN